MSNTEDECLQILSQNFENSSYRGIIITIIEGSGAWHYTNIIRMDG